MLVLLLIGIAWGYFIAKPFFCLAVFAVCVELFHEYNICRRGE